MSDEGPSALFSFTLGRNSCVLSDVKHSSRGQQHPRTHPSHTTSHTLTHTLRRSTATLHFSFQRSCWRFNTCRMNNAAGKVFLNVEGEMRWHVTGTDVRYVERLTALLPSDVAAGGKKKPQNTPNSFHVQCNNYFHPVILIRIWLQRFTFCTFLFRRFTAEEENSCVWGRVWCLYRRPDSRSAGIWQHRCAGECLKSALFNPKPQRHSQVRSVSWLYTRFTHVVQITRNSSVQDVKQLWKYHRS